MSVYARRCQLAAATGFLAVSFVLTACGGSASTPPAAAPASTVPVVSAEHNAADLRFVQGMIPHHEQAVMMAELAATRAQSPEVKQLAAQIQGAQDPEIQVMRRFLQTWGAAASITPMPDMDHGGSGAEGSGMMTPQQMGQLQGATGAQFDRMFLQMMVAHHRGAITSSQQELAEGLNPQAKQLANQIIAAQSAEITRMEQLSSTV